MLPSTHQPKKLLRASRACDFCHKRSIKCRPSSAHASVCQNCHDFDVPCTYKRPLKRGRAANNHDASKASTSSGAINAGSQHYQQPEDFDLSQTASIIEDKNATTLLNSNAKILEASAIQDGSAATRSMQTGAWEGLIEECIAMPWKAFAATSATTIGHLVHVYLQVVYPIFPLFHETTLLEIVRTQAYLHNPGTFSSVMAACALASARARDGALYGSSDNMSHIGSVPSETFYAAAKDTIPRDLKFARDFNFLRSFALLSITSIQYGDIEALHLYLGHYFTLVGMYRFNDEAYWPKDITNIETEERRRLYWSVYTLDVYVSIVWNGSVHAYGSTARVRYPTEAPDELITPIVSLPSPQSTTTWLRGWNFTTDLYLTLEHVFHRLRESQSRFNDRIDIAAVFDMPAAPPTKTSSEAVLASINALYAGLPDQFKLFAPPTRDRKHDIFGFQAANIQATLLLLRTLFLCGDDDPQTLQNVQLKCNVAAELVAVFQNIPTAYLCGISTPLIYHLAGIGMILGSMMQRPLSEAVHHKVKDILLSIADLLDSLETGLSRAADTSKGIRAQVERIDEYMRGQRLTYGRTNTNTDHDTFMNVSDESDTSCLPSQHRSDPNLGASMLAAGTGNAGEATDLAVTEDVGVGEAVEGFPGDWFGEVQLPPELLEDWSWPFNLQPDGWSFLGGPGFGGRGE